MSKHLQSILAFVVIFLVYLLTSPQNHSEAEDVYDFALRVEQGGFAEQAGVNRVLALPVFGAAYRGAQFLGYSGRAFAFMIFINRLLAVVSLFLFGLLLHRRREAGSPDDPSSRLCQSYVGQAVLCLAFSYGFWRYANEAETYMLAGVLVLLAWVVALGAVSSRFSVARILFSVFCPLISALGILVHLLNLIPLLLIIPLYYLLCGLWKRGLVHGGATVLLVAAGYGVCSPWLDFGELGAQHHALEGGFAPVNLLRGGIAFGQCLVGGNFLFGFEGFRAFLSSIFPSRMLGEEFFMGRQMAGWIPWAGVASVLGLLGLGVWFGVKLCRGVSGCGGKGVKEFWGKVIPGAQCPMPNAFILATIVWLMLYAVAVIRTEAGSPELWILALIPFWLLISPLLKGRLAWVLVAALFVHNLIGGLLPVMSESGDYHVAKGKWVAEKAGPGDLILSSYEPILLFYLNYFSEAEVINSGLLSVNEIHEKLGACGGESYALGVFFSPISSMKVRRPEMYELMVQRGKAFRADFVRIREDEFGGVYGLRKSMDVLE